jgi:predicted nucleotidyltransferase
LDGARYFTAMSELSGLLASPVDLVELESAQPSLRERIAFEGLPL